MIYQKIFTEEKPYSIMLSNVSKFPEHRHADFEFNFCVEGEFDIIINRKNYRVGKGFTTLIPPMCAHSVPEHENEHTVITLIVGTTLLKKYFEDFRRLAVTPKVYDLSDSGMEELRRTFEECADIINSKDMEAELLLTGNVYRILACFLRFLSRCGESEERKSDYRQIENVERALELIHYRYKESVTVEEAAAITGYSKSNFCKIFKTVVGESFHQALNRHRVNNAAGLLRFSNMSVSDIAHEVGFSETKAFCRVFKAVFGASPGQYRKMK